MIIKFNSYIKESKYNDLEIGDRVLTILPEELKGTILYLLYHYNHKIGYIDRKNTHGVCTVQYGDEHKSDRVTFMSDWIFKIKEGEKIEDKLKEIEQNKEERERKKEEIRLKMMNIDPYGEEDWGVDEGFNWFKKNKPVMRVNHKSDIDPYGEEDWNNLEEKLKENLFLLLSNDSSDKLTVYKVYLRNKKYLKYIYLGKMNYYELKPNFLDFSVSFKFRKFKYLDSYDKIKSLISINDNSDFSNDVLSNIINRLNDNQNVYNIVKEIISQ